MEKNQDKHTVMNIHEKLHIEKITLDWIVDNRYQLFILIILSGLLKVVSKLPYLSLIISDQVIIFIASITAFFILNIGIKRPILIGILTFIPALVLQLIGESKAAEITGNFAFGIILVTTVTYLLKHK